MRTENFIPDFKKIEAMDRSDLEKIVNNISNVAHAFFKLETEKGHSLSDFFLAYILSPEFQNHDRERQMNIFESYEYAKFAISEINSLMCEYEISESYN